MGRLSLNIERRLEKEPKMSRIAPVDPTTPDAEARDALARMRALWGNDWMIARIMANSPSLLNAFAAFWEGLQNSSLEPEDREIIALEMAATNDCHYCKPAHLMLARHQGIPDAEIKSVLSGGTPSDSRARLIQNATRRLLETRGRLTDQEFRDFQNQGLTERQLIEVVGEIAHCTLTNYLNRLAQTDLDPFFPNIRD